MSRPKLNIQLSTCPHSWNPWRANWEFATCQYCGGEAMWSHALGKYVRLIPESWSPEVRERRINARQKAYPRPRA